MKKLFIKTKFVMLALLASFSASAAGTSYVQLIHNCADPAASTVSVYADFGSGQTLISSSFAFRTATAFLSVPSSTSITAYIKAAGASASDPAIYSQVLGPLAADSSYVVIASGLVGSGFAVNPNSLNTAFGLKLLAPARKTSFTSGKVDFAVFHGATDAPGVDVKLTGGATLVPNAKYGDASGYLSVNPTWYPIDITPAGMSTVVASYVADLTTLAGGSAVVFASGFLTPTANNNGAAFGLFAALANGTVIPLPARKTASVQVLHNCADPIADSVDVYLNGALAIDNFPFRTSTPFISLTAGFPNNVAIAPKNSASVADSVWQTNYTLAADSNYILTASGLIGSGFAANPNGVNTGFQVLVKTSARKQATLGTNFDFFAIHGATDAPIVDVKANGVLTLVNNAKYTDQTAYISVPTASYTLAVQDSSGANTIVSYTANLTSLAGKSAVVLASGFLTPSANKNGKSFGLYVALAQGGPFIELPTYTSVKDISNEISWNMFPNPSQGTLSIAFDLKNADNVSVQVIDMNGRIMKELFNGNSVYGKQTLNADLNDLSSGIYIARIITSENTLNSKFSLVK